MSATFCVPIVDERVLTLKDNKFAGYAGNALENVMDLGRRVLKNITWVESEKYGDLVDQQEQRYDGCIGELQQNRLQFTLMPTYFPMMAPNITNGAIHIASKATIVSAYNNTDFKHTHTDVMEFFRAFDPDLWVATFFATLVLVLIQLLTIRIRVRVSPFSFLHTLVTAVALKQFGGFNITSSRLSVRITLLLIGIFFLQIHFFLTSMIKTQLVVHEAPDTLSDYKEILQHPNCTPLWPNLLSASWEFEHADQDSSAGKIWKRAVTMGRKNTRVGLKLEDIPSMMDRITRKAAVLFLPSWALKPFVSNICAISRSFGIFTEANIWHRIDPEATERLMSLVRSSNVSKEVAQKMDVAATRWLEHGTEEPVQNSLSFIAAKDSGKPDIKDCMANTIIYPEYGLGPINVWHFRGIWQALIIGSSLAAIVCMFEIYVHYMRT